MKPILFALLTSTLFGSLTAHAESEVVLPQPDASFDGEEVVLLPLEKIAQSAPIIGASSPEITQTQASEQAEPNLEQQINHALVIHDWKMLKPLLEKYYQQDKHDTVLYHYALGALQRHEMHHNQAIDSYRKMLAERPDLVYPRFDLGVMLFENKQYREAEAEISQVKPKLHANLQRLAQEYLDEIVRVQRWQPEMSATYEQTDNVNNASSANTFMWGGKEWKKNEDSLPQKAHGISYNVGLERDWNVGGNHFAVLGATLDGVHYWDKKEYSEQSLRFQTGYRFRDVRQTLGLLPFAEQNWYGGARYSQNFGATAEYSYRFTPKWRLSSSYTYLYKHYHEDDVAKRYDGRLNAVSLTALWQATPHWLLLSGVDNSHDHVREKAQSSTRTGVRLGFVYGAKKWGTQWNMRYGKRQFADENLFSGSVRDDKEYQISSAIWHNKLSWKGFTPKLNYRYNKIDSNIPYLYSRQGARWFVSVDKAF